MSIKLLIVDNYDSFTYTIKSYFDVLGVETLVLKNDNPQLANLEQLNPTHILLSPGYGTPNDAGYTMEIVLKYSTCYPILGVCLGHQSIAQAFGAKIIHAPEAIHGKVSFIFNDGCGLFKNIPNPFRATRYHSLVILPSSLPREFNISGWTTGGVNDDTPIIMAIQHKSLPLCAVQFHPESVLSEYGYEIFRNFLDCE